MEIEFRALEEYLKNRYGADLQITEISLLGGKTTGAAALKQFGYGQPFLVSCRIGDRVEQIVFHHISRNAFGHERDADRVAAVWLDYNTFNLLPRHVPAVDMVAYTGQGELQSLGSAQEVVLVTAYRPGCLYADDLIRIRDEEKLQPLDVRRATALAAYLAEIHQVKHDDPTLWRRRLRDLVGHGEGIMGLTDSYPQDLTWVTVEELRAIEEMANRWRWRLKPLSHRLSQVHGDFHPFNVLFEEGTEFHVLDRSRGEWGEPADDVSCMTINYLFFSLQRYGWLEGPFLELHNRFWEHYLALHPDGELVTAIQPWFAWRALVVASPLWYPTIPDTVRRKLLTFARRVMSTDRYDYRRVNLYIKET
ncbi:MAG: phosphotransferase [Chloroflexi bacterium]|nr:phosphotransferase [Chloroflexota bacterium]